MDGAGSSVHWHQRRKTSDTHQIPRLCLSWTNAGKKGHKEPARGGQAALYWPAAPTGGLFGRVAQECGVFSPTEA